MKASVFSSCVALASLLCVNALAQTPNVTGSCNTTNLFVPGAAGTIALAVNHYDTVVGEYLDESSYQLYAFRWNGGKFTTYVYPSANGTQFNGINDSGLIVGAAGVSGNSSNPATDLGLTYQNGVVHTFSYPGATQTAAFGVNNYGTIVGAYLVPGGTRNPAGVVPWDGFIKKGSAFTRVVYPGAYATYARAISDTGVVVGSYFTATGREHGFMYANGKYQQIDVPGAYSTQVDGISKYGSLVGDYRPTSASGLQGWGYTGGKFYKATYPVMLQGVNNLGDRVGATSLSNGSQPGLLLVCR